MICVSCLCLLVCFAGSSAEDDICVQDDPWMTKFHKSNAIDCNGKLLVRLKSCHCFDKYRFSFASDYSCTDDASATKIDIWSVLIGSKLEEKNDRRFTWECGQIPGERLGYICSASQNSVSWNCRCDSDYAVDRISTKCNDLGRRYSEVYCSRLPYNYVTTGICRIKRFEAFTDFDSGLTTYEYIVGISVKEMKYKDRKDAKIKDSKVTLKFCKFCERPVWGKWSEWGRCSICSALKPGERPKKTRSRRCIRGHPNIDVSECRCHGDYMQTASCVCIQEETYPLVSNGSSPCAEPSSWKVNLFESFNLNCSGALLQRLESCYCPKSSGTRPCLTEQESKLPEQIGLSPRGHYYDYDLLERRWNWQCASGRFTSQETIANVSCASKNCTCPANAVISNVFSRWHESSTITRHENRREYVVSCERMLDSFAVTRVCRDMKLAANRPRWELTALGSVFVGMSWKRGIDVKNLEFNFRLCKYCEKAKWTEWGSWSTCLYCYHGGAPTGVKQRSRKCIRGNHSLPEKECRCLDSMFDSTECLCPGASEVFVNETALLDAPEPADVDNGDSTAAALFVAAVLGTLILCWILLTVLCVVKFRRR